MSAVTVAVGIDNDTRRLIESICYSIVLLKDTQSISIIFVKAVVTTGPGIEDGNSNTMAVFSAWTITESDPPDSVPSLPAALVPGLHPEMRNPIESRSIVVNLRIIPVNPCAYRGRIVVALQMRSPTENPLVRFVAIRVVCLRVGQSRSMKYGRVRSLCPNCGDFP